MNMGQQIVAAVQNATTDTEVIAALEGCRLDLSHENPDPVPLLSMGEHPVCTRGNFSVIIGLAGSRKSFLCTAFGGAYLNEDGFLGVENSNGKGKILWIDTEQSAGHVARIGRRLHRIAGLPQDENNHNVIIYMLREFSPNMRLKMIDTAIKLHRPDLVVIDGLADLIDDVNNPEQSTEVITFLLSITAKIDCHILTVIHCNPNSEKARGHLGSEAMRKAETVIVVKADGLTSNCEFVKTRDIRPDNFAFVVSEGLPTQTPYITKEGRTNKSEQFFDEVMPDLPQTIRYSELVQLITQKANIKQAAAKNRIASAINAGIIVKNSVGMYHRPKVDNADNIVPF